MYSPLTAIINAKLIVNKSIIKGKILLFNDKIIDILDDLPRGDKYQIDIIDAQGHYVSAGFIDLHIHGAGGADVMDATAQALEILSTTLPQTGTTSFLATTMTMPSMDIEKALINIQKNAQKVTGSNILGIHLEGPFINAKKHGAQDKAYIQPPNLELIQNYIDDIKMITLAPEIEGSENFIKYLTKEYPHIILSIGHSEASYVQSKKSFEWGVSHATHLFNAMNPYHHRAPGVVGAVFDSDVTCDIIADLIHTDASVLALVHKIKQDKLILITDAMRAGCMKCGMYDLGGRSVRVTPEGEALLEDGTLAGSVLQMNEALQHMVQYSDMDVHTAVNAVTDIPARKLGIQKGSLQKGYDADIVIFDEKFSIITTIINGEVKYIR